MKTDNKVQVADAKQAYLKWNSFQYKRLPELIENENSQYISLIPFLLQINHKLMPGYTGMDTPVGVFGYKPDKKTLYEARLLNTKFRYQSESVIKNAAIDAVFFQKQLINGEIRCWVFYRSSFNKRQVAVLEKKVNKISQWFSARGLKLEFLCISDLDFRNNKAAPLSQNNKAIFLDYFYSEVILLAGKYPLWWLVPGSKENEYVAYVEHIKQARFVDNEEFIDLGSTGGLDSSALVKHAIDTVQKIKLSPEVCLVKLLIIDQKNNRLPELDGVSNRIKKLLYQGNTSTTPEAVIAAIMHDALGGYKDNLHVMPPLRLFSRLKVIPGNLNKKIVDSFLGEEIIYESAAQGIENIIAYLNFFKAVAHEIRQIFSSLVTRYNASQNVHDLDQNLTRLSRNMLVFLSEKSDRVPLYNNKEKIDIILQRILLRHEIISDSEDHWNLILQADDGTEKTINGFNNLLALLTWCWLNRVVNQSTQVSIDCPIQQIKQTEARYVLEVLFQQFNPQMITSIPAQAFENPVHPLQSMIFISFISTNSHEQLLVSESDNPFEVAKAPMKFISHCEQLIINSWGDVYTKTYKTNMGLLRCMCEWTHNAPLNELKMPPPFSVFGHGTGESTYLAQRVTQIYKEMLSFFYQNREESGRFILKLAADYYVILVENFKLKPIKIGGLKVLMSYLEASVESFQSTALETLAYAEHPLREIYQNNKNNKVQVFFQLINRSYHTWVLDEKGCLWTDVVEIHDRESYITHWLYLFKNIRKRLASIQVDEIEIPSLAIRQISINQLGGFEFYSVAEDTTTSGNNFIELKLSIKNVNGQDQLSLLCDGQGFNYQDFGKNVLIECVQYITSRIIREGSLPVYITDIDIPLRLYNLEQVELIHTSHVLKFKRNFERRILNLLEA